MAPVVTSVSPAQGAPAGGTNVTITGSGFTGATMVRFGPNGTTFVIVSDMQITAKTPAGAGTVQVTVAAPTGTSTQNVFFTYTPAPVLTTLIPPSGPTAGGNTVTINGTNLSSATSVKFGSNSAVIVTNTATQITVIAPAGSPSSVNVTVTTAGGTSNALPYTYATVPAPAINSLSPTSGPTAGGNTVTINGTNLSSATSVKFGSNSAVIVTNTATQITVIAPAGSPSSVNVTVTTAGGTSNALPYTYATVPAPAINSLSPTSGPTAGGNTVTINGTNLSSATSVKFGSNSAVIVTNTATQITVIAPAGSPSSVNVTVTTAGGTSNALPYTYATVPAPAINSLSPTSGPTAGGNTVTINGTNLSSATSVKFGSNSAVIVTNTATQITVIAPAGSPSSVNVTVTTAGGTSNALPYTYATVPAPAINSLSPTSGPTAGGNTVTINGTNLSSATSVKFGSNSAVIVTNTATQITVIAPAGSPSSVNVTVTTAGGTSNALPYTYATVPAPAINSLSPTSGPTAGGNTVTINGTNLSSATSVKFGSNSAVIVTNTATQITVIAPAGSPSSVNVTVTTAGGTSNALPYTYATVPAPAINSLSPTSGPTAGGNTVTINGTNLSSATSVKFGSNSAVIVTNTATQITVIAPAGSPSSVNVTVTTAGGTSNPLPYFYLAAPTLSDLSPHLGPTGGNTVTVFGTNLTLTNAVSFGGNPATSINVVSDSQVTVTAPAGLGTVAVTVTTPGGTSSAATGNPYYTYLGAPVLTSLNPSHGADLGGDAIVLGGSNLTYTDAVSFGGVPASFAAISDTQVVATSPGGAPGTVNVVAHTPAGNSNTLPYVYDPS
ncbi:IPT/TIG domain-containing protein [Streptomyces sp. NBC_01456]|uniref:beta strand repeat-containing protein n=1 Tax=unclassified Streptomyces TaxID=2593676 RepID=UPI002E325B28|nr:MULTISPECIES: IPT/TIG domain-containing protein [unclassified Streptomyces]